MEETEKLWEKYGLVCKRCGHRFFPWKALMVTLPKNNMQPYLYCPNCGNYDNMSNFKDN